MPLPESSSSTFGSAFFTHEFSICCFALVWDLNDETSLRRYIYNHAQIIIDYPLWMPPFLSSFVIEFMPHWHFHPLN